MKLFVLIILLCNQITAHAACLQLYGKQNPGGDWNFSIVQDSGMIPAESDSNCMAQAGAYILQNGRWVLDPILLAAKLAAEAKTKEDSKLVDAKTIKTLEDRIKALEDAVIKLPK